ncbi:UBA domain-containing protein [Aphelenchoides fujianensis]|nr:UBA domain-containing protein [Aphelenchoides fujianensis]
MSVSHSLCDYIRDINMEIGPHFLPPPVVHLPNTNVSLRLPPCEYSFEAEQKFLDKLSSGAFERQSAPSSSRAEEPKPIAQIAAVQPENRLFHDLKVQTPSPFIPKVAPQPRQPPATASKPPLHGLEEFESGKNVFDLLELRCIDEKAELEAILGSMTMDTNK